MICNIHIPSFWPNLVWFTTDVVGFMFSVLRVFHFFCMIHFVQEFLVFFYFGFAFGFFWGQTKIFRSVYGRTKTFRVNLVRSTRSGWPSKKNLGSRILIPCLFCNVFFLKGLWFKGVFSKHPSGLFWIILLQEKKRDFARQILKNIYKK
jgi:hypothetical protein